MKNRKIVYFGIAMGSFLITMIVIIVIYKNGLNNIKIEERIGYTVECNTKNNLKSMNIWLEDYMNQFKQKGLDKKLIIKNYTITKSELLGDNIIEFEFNIKSQKDNPELVKILDGKYEAKSWLIKCQWILKYEIIDKNKKIYYKVVDEYDEAKEYKNDEFKEVEQKQEEMTGMDKKTKEEYDKKYKEADDRSREAYNKEFMEQSSEPQVDNENTYRIYNDKCSISYNNGKKWSDVPVSLEELCYVVDGNSYYNKLQTGSFIINSEGTILTYGGTQKVPLSIIKSEDKGKTWKKIIVDKNHKVMLSGD